jgi:hypothetical protein
MTASDMLLLLALTAHTGHDITEHLYCQSTFDQLHTLLHQQNDT